MGNSIYLKFTSFLLLILVILIPLPLYSGQAIFTQQSAVVVQVPHKDKVESMRPVLVFVSAVGDVVLDVSIKIVARFDKALPYVTLPNPLTLDLSIPMIPLPVLGGYSVAVIPGLPAYNYTFKVPIVERVTLIISSSVDYAVVVKGSTVFKGSYTVQPVDYTRDLSPIVFAVVYDVVENPGLINKTLGLAPAGWVAEAGREVRVIAVAIDDKDLSELELEYSVSGGAWQRTQLQNMLPQLDNARSKINDWLSTIENTIRNIKPDFSTPKLGNNFKAGLGVIPGQQAGEYIKFRAQAKDSIEQTSRSLIGLYYTMNINSPTRILIIDPSIVLWLLKHNSIELLKYIESKANYNVPEEILKTVKNSSLTQKILEYHGPPFFHYWNNLGEDYNIYIVYPSREISEVLENFKPNIIILSNLYLGLVNLSTLNWDLNDIDVLSDLIKYVKRNNAGVIATHGTLSDWVIWSVDCSSKVKVGSRGHVGSNLSDMNIIEENTIAALLGISELALWEYTRDTLAMLICSGALAPLGIPIPPQVGAAIGSIPLLIPYIPFSGMLRTTPEAQYTGWSLPSEFTITVPEAGNTLNFKAYTTVGWQLALPRAIAYSAWSRLNEVRGNASAAMNRFAQLVENTTDRFAHRDVLFNYIDSSMNKWSRELYRALVSSSIRGYKFSVNISLPEGTININISLPREALDSLFQKLPVKLIAVSSDSLAAIIIHDKYWDKSGYRAVYFSFEIEASPDPIASKLLKQAVDWAAKWEYKPITELLGSVRVPKDIAKNFKSIVEKLPGDIMLSQNIVLNEEGASWIEIPAMPGKLHIVMAHPTTDKIDIVNIIGDCKVTEVVSVNKTTTVSIDVYSQGTIKIGLKASSDLSLNPTYVLVKQELLPTPTPTPTPSPTPSPTPTPTPTPTPLEWSVIIPLAIAVVVIVVIIGKFVLKRK